MLSVLSKVIGVFYLLHLTQASPHGTGHSQCNVKGDTANCSYLHLTEIPTDLMPTVKVLYLDGNNFNTLVSNSFNAFPALTNLSLANSNVSILDVDTFKGLSKLLSLDLRNNKINSRSLVQRLFKDLKSLKTLNLQNTTTTRIAQSLFDNLTKLEELHLERNKLTSIHDHAFTKLTALEWISIAHNFLTTASDKWFRPVTKTLTHIAMDHNPWNCSKGMCEFKKWAQTLSKQLSGMMNVFCRDFNKPLKSVHTSSLCDVSINVETGGSVPLTCPDKTATEWTFMSKNVSLNIDTIQRSKKKIEKAPGKLTLKNAAKHDSGQYCCHKIVEDSSTKHCFFVKVTTSKSIQPASSGGGGTAAVIIILVIIAMTAFTVWHCKRKRRSYGVLNDDSVYQPTYDERAESMRIPRHNAEQTEVGEAYV